MRKSEIFDRCVFLIDSLLKSYKLKLRTHDNISVHKHFCPSDKIYAGVVVSSFDGEAGVISRAWGIVFSSPDSPLRCTDIHTSYYGESVALGKLLDELNKLSK